jgi:hypothetical protein
MTTLQLFQFQQFSTFALTGIIWLVQALVYPNFKFVPPSSWPEFHRRHTRTISFIVAPLMLTELCSGIAIAIVAPKAQVIQLILLAVIWASTFAIQVPLHQRLSISWDHESIDRLIRTNWIRTVAWNLKSMALIAPIQL